MAKVTISIGLTDAQIKALSALYVLDWKIISNWP